MLVDHLQLLIVTSDIICPFYSWFVPLIFHLKRLYFENISYFDCDLSIFLSSVIYGVKISVGSHLLSSSNFVEDESTQYTCI